ncbi:MAG: homoserine kinase [Anaerolineales bacterium]
MKITLQTPATTANLGPGFDCLGLALDLWNRVHIQRAGRGVYFEIRGEGADDLPRDDSNLLWQAMKTVYAQRGVPLPDGVRITCENAIPLGSGLGSSAAAVVAGLLGGNALLGNPYSPSDLLSMAVTLEGHPDNAAATLWGGLVISAGQHVRRLEVPVWTLVYVLPAVQLATREARRVLPAQIPLHDAVTNLGNALLVVEALRAGDLTLLRAAMQDTWHQPYRLPLIPGMAAVFDAARRAGAAVALSGAGPGAVAFCAAERTGQVKQAMLDALPVPGRAWILQSTSNGACIAQGDVV